jgi:hypothetical protein
LLVVQHCFGDARQNDSDAKLTRLVAFDDRDVGVADVVFDAVADLSITVPAGKASAIGTPPTRADDHSSTSDVP